MAEAGSRYSAWPASARWAWFAGRPLCTLGACLVPWAVVGWAPALAASLAVLVVRPTTRWYVGLLLAAAVAAVAPPAGAFVLARLVVGELTLRALGGSRRAGLGRVRAARLAFAEGIDLIDSLPPDLGAAWTEVRRHLAARHAFTPAPERDRDRFELEDSLAAYVLVAWSEADLVVLLRAGGRVAAGLLLGRWYGMPDFVPGEDDLLRGLPEAFASGVCRALGVLVSVVGCGLAVDGPAVGLGPVDVPRALVAAVLAGWAVLAATSRLPSATQLVVVAIGGGLLLRGDAVVVAAVVAGAAYALTRARRRITTFLLAGRRTSKTARTLGPRDTGLRLYGQWRAAELAAAAGRRGIAIAVLRQLVEAATARGAVAVAAAAQARIAVLEIQRGRVQHASDAADAGAHLLAESAPTRRRRRTLAVARSGIAHVRLEVGQDALDMLPDLAHLPSRWPEARQAWQASIDAYTRAGRADAVLDLIERAHSRWAARDTVTAVDSQVAVAQALYISGEVEHARSYLADEVLTQMVTLGRQAEKLPTRDAKQRVVVISGRASLLHGQLELQAGSPRAAVTAFEQAAARVRATGALSLLASAHVLKGAALARLERWADAVAAIEEGVDALEAQRRQLTSGDARTQAIVSADQLYRTAFASLHAAQQGGSDQAGVVAAVLMEALHQNALADALRSADFALDAEGSDLLDRVRTVDVGDREQVTEGARDDLAEIMNRAFAQAYLPRGVDLDRLRGLCGPAHVLSYYCPQGGPSAYCVWMPPGGSPVIHAVEIADPAAAALLAFLGSGDSAEPLELGRPVLSPAAAGTWTALADGLLPPALIEDLRRSDVESPPHLLVVPDGPMARVPWPALLVDPQRTLIEVATIQLAPALEILEPAPPTPVGRQRAILHADPALMDTAARVALIEDLATSSASLHLVPHDGRDEIVDALRHPWWVGAVFAAHGTGAGLDQQVRLGDGEFLSMFDLLARGMQWPSWVLLGSCFVGAVEQRVGDEPLGLPIVCLLGGADSVIGGTVEVDDQLAGRLSRTVLDGLARGLHPATALREGQLALVGSRVNGWAAFACISRLAPGGDGAGPAEVVRPQAITTSTTALTTDDSATRALLDRSTGLQSQLATTTSRKRVDLAQSLHLVASELDDLGLHNAAIEANDGVVAALRDLARRGSEPYLDGLALALNHRAVYLGNLGRHDEAVAASVEAIALTRRLLRRPSPDRLADLAQSLANMGLDLRKLRRHDEAIAAVEEAVALRRRLADGDPAAVDDLAGSLRNYGRVLAAGGRHDDAIRAFEEYVDVRRDQADRDPEKGRPRLVGAIETLCAELVAAGRHDETLGPHDEAVRVYRDLAVARPAKYFPDLARLLAGRAASIAERGEHEQAVALLDEVVILRRQLTESDFRERPLLAEALLDLGISLSRLDRDEEAAAADEEALAIYRALASAEPARYRPKVAHTLVYLSIDLAELGDPARALPFVDEAVAMRRELVAEEPDRFRPSLAEALQRRAHRLDELGRHGDQADTLAELVEINEQLAETDTVRYLPKLAGSAADLGGVYTRLDRHDDALAAVELSLAAYERLAADDRATWLPKLANALFERSFELAELGRDEEAVAAIDVAIAAYREREASEGASLSMTIGRLLHNRGLRQNALGRKDESRASFEEALVLLRDVSREDPAELPALARSLGRLELLLDDLGHDDDAAAVLEEIVRVRTQLADADPDADLSWLVSALGRLASHRRRQGRLDEAIEARERQIAYRRTMVDVGPADLAGPLYYYGIVLHEAGRVTDAVAAATEEVGLWRQVVAAGALDHLADLAIALNNLAAFLDDDGRLAEALPIAEEAVARSRHLVDHTPDEAGVLAVTLTTKAALLRTFSRPADARAAAEEAVSICTTLPDTPRNRTTTSDALGELAAVDAALGPEPE